MNVDMDADGMFPQKRPGWAGPGWQLEVWLLLDSESGRNSTISTVPGQADKGPVSIARV